MQLSAIKEPSNRSKKLFSDAVAIQSRLYELGFNSVIAGGFARDLFFGVEPKDVDIIIYGKNADEFEQVLNLGRWEDECDGETYTRNKVAGAARTEELFQGGEYLAMYGEMREGVELSDRVDGVYQIKHKNIDIIIYIDCETAIEVIDSFDFNINQFAMFQDHEKGETYPHYFGETSLCELKLIRNDASDTRRLKVYNKHLALKPLIDQLTAEGALPCA